ncbi:hypothetical protein H310_02290 [Aphanomyces invadans]|uniref:Uncharacterized protein n=1 Tax=Aphanomyces invadans TaxID=157072 RepID=A0A024UN61_9STRA|nr:hypothetical protein H310_02290 [Aphanomyces invadans]ETW07871.1 hypothetical protein H310_02290 [Aphanomyces invadans]|eukprot:XP_008863964.1 hypothetical protein H310_02290 [Aphanomyces invadans]
MAYHTLVCTLDTSDPPTLHTMTWHASSTPIKSINGLDLGKPHQALLEHEALVPKNLDKVPKVVDLQRHAVGHLEQLVHGKELAIALDNAFSQSSHVRLDLLRETHATASSKIQVALLCRFDLGTGLGETDERFQLSHRDGDAVGRRVCV